MPRFGTTTQTRSGKRLYPSKSCQAFKEVRIPCKKRHTSAIDYPQLQDDAPAPKKQNSSKTVRFEDHADCEHGVARYKGSSPQDSLEAEKESGPSEELLRRTSIAVDQSLAESEEENRLEVMEAKGTEQCVVDTKEDSNDDELVTSFMTELEENPAISLIDDFYNEREDDLLNQRADAPENGDQQPIPKNQVDAVIAIASSNLSPTDQKDKDREYKQRYLDLKTTAWHWSSTYFSPPTPTLAATPTTLNLPELCHTSPQLMEYANYISVCTDSATWEDVFTEQRAFLVYCILGKMIEVHVLGHEMFGATDEQLCILRTADEECMMDDGILLPPIDPVPAPQTKS